MYAKSVVVLAFAVFAVVTADDCSKKFKQDDTHIKVSDMCTKTLKISQNDLPQNESDFTKSYDDKVSTHCYRIK